MTVEADEMNCILTGTIGHVAHGKSTVVKAISGVQVFLCLLLLGSRVEGSSEYLYIVYL